MARAKNQKRRQRPPDNWIPVYGISPKTGKKYLKGYENPITDEYLSRRQYDQRHGRLAREGFKNYLEKTLARVQAGISSSTKYVLDKITGTVRQRRQGEKIPATVRRRKPLPVDETRHAPGRTTYSRHNLTEKEARTLAAELQRRGASKVLITIGIRFRQDTELTFFSQRIQTKHVGGQINQWKSIYLKKGSEFTDMSPRDVRYSVSWTVIEKPDDWLKAYYQANQRQRRTMRKDARDEVVRLTLEGHHEEAKKLANKLDEARRRRTGNYKRLKAVKPAKPAKSNK